MDQGFFKWVWRFNAVAIAVGIILVFGVILVTQVFQVWQRTSTQAILNADVADPTIARVVRHRNVRFDAGTGLIHFDVVRSNGLALLQSPDVGRFKPGVDLTVNKGFMDVATGETRWLLDGTGQGIVWTQSVYGEQGPPSVDRYQAGTEDRRSIAEFYRIVTEDTSGDGRLSDADKGTVHLADPDGQNLKALMENVTEVYDVIWQDKQTRILHMRTQGNDILAIVSLTERTIVQELPLPKP